MQRLLRCGGLFLLLLALVVPAFATSQEKGDETKVKKGDDPKKKEKFTYGQKFVGKVTQVDATTKNFTLKMTFKEINPDAQRHIATEQQSYLTEIQRANTTKNAQTRANHLQNAARHQKNMLNWQAKMYKDSHRDAKFQPAEKVIYRVLTPEPEYDDKGNLKAFSKKELELLRYPPNIREKLNVDTKKLTKEELADLDVLKGVYADLPGYFAEADALRANLDVAVYTPKGATGGTTKKKKLDDDDVVVGDRQTVILIIIQNQVAAPPK